MFIRKLTHNSRNRVNINFQNELNGLFLSSTLFQHRLQQERLRSERSKQPLSLLIVDLKQLLEIITNRTGMSYRHVLNHFGHTIKTMTRECDVKGWLRKEEIAILTPDTDDAGAQALVRNLAIHLTSHPHLKRNGLQHEVEQRFVIHSSEGELSGLATSSGINTSRPTTRENYRTQSFFANLDQNTHHLSLNTGNAALAIDIRPFSFEIPVLIQLQGLQRILKRIIDIIGSFVGIVLGAPLMAVIALLIKLTSPGPVIFRQQRLGFAGKPISFLKFRSMKANNDDSIHKAHVEKLIKKSKPEGINQSTAEESAFKLTNDPRITGLGKFLRKTSLDELPQLFNVLKGDMSLVGPRPHPIYECELYKPWHWRRISEVKPGITGLWQVNGRLNTTYDEQIRLDLDYIRRWNLWLDLKILMKTFWAVISTKGAA